jgi:hypothetical protein
MARGNQREKAREKNLKNKPAAKKDDGLTPMQRRERDALRLAEKVKNKQQLASE